MDFFNKCLTSQEASSLYHKLSKLFHPDRGGDNALMMELSRQYREWMPKGDGYQSFQKINPNINNVNTENLVNHYRNYVSILEKAVEKKNEEIDDLYDQINEIKTLTFMQKISYLFSKR